jgi:uncharacterized membrane protein
MKRGSQIILIALIIFAIAIIFGIGIPLGPEALLLLLFVVIPGYVVYRILRWGYEKLVA